MQAMRMRWLAAAAVLVSAAIHLYLWLDGMREEDVLGPAFLLNAVGGAAIAILLITWEHWIPPFLALGFGLSTLSGFVVSTTVGLFGVTSTWEGWEAWTAAVVELVAIATGGLLLYSGNPWSHRQAHHDASVGGAHLD